MSTLPSSTVHAIEQRVAELQALVALVPPTDPRLRRFAAVEADQLSFALEGCRVRCRLDAEQARLEVEEIQVEPRRSWLGRLAPRARAAPLRLAAS